MCIGLYPLVALEQSVTPRQKGVLDLGKILLWNRHALRLLYWVLRVRWLGAGSSSLRDRH